MKELGITKGEWQFEIYAGFYAIQNTSGYSSNDLLLASEVGSFEAEHNAELICDAGNTAQKCGLLPSELLKQRDELKEALLYLMDGVSGLPPLTAIVGVLEQQYIQAEAAIKSTER